MRKLLILLLPVLFFAACTNQQQEKEYPDPQVVTNLEQEEGVFIHITHAGDDVHRLLMGLTLAHKMSKDKNVLVYLDIEAVKAALKNSEDYTMEGFESSKTLIQKLIDNEVDVMVCPGCLKAAGISEQDIMRGVMIAEKEKFFNFTSGRIISLDY